jgi:two-component system, chemotaxis family, response regulator Rcp1
MCVVLIGFDHVESDIKRYRPMHSRWNMTCWYQFEGRSTNLCRWRCNKNMTDPRCQQYGKARLPWPAPKRTILLVDDNKADVELIRRSLSIGPNAPTLLVADDGVEALRMLRETLLREHAEPALILLDLNLPRKTGHEVLEEIKEDPALRHIPVVVLSSSNSERDVSKAYELHANCYLTKPMDLDGFANILQSIERFWLSMAELPSYHY